MQIDNNHSLDPSLDPSLDIVKAERSIQRAGLLALSALLLTVPAARYLVAPLLDWPNALDERLAFAALASVPVGFCVLIAVFFVSTGRRLSAQDIGGAAAGPPGPKIALHVAFLQNTLEQAFLAVVLYFALAVLLPPLWLVLIPTAVAFFVVGRLLFLWGYPRSLVGRAPGMTLTLLPTALGYLLALVLILLRWF